MPKLLQRRQRFCQSREELFPFFADAYNLERITPPWLKFRVLTAAPIEMHVGTLIDYRLSLYGIPVRWRTEIRGWDPPHRFVDAQLRGPYRLWVHEHRFEDDGDGCLMIDRVEYISPVGWLVHRPLVTPQVERIFDYRCDALRKIFGPEE